LKSNMLLIVDLDQTSTVKASTKVWLPN